MTNEQRKMVEGALALEANLEGRTVGAADLLMPARLAGPLARLVLEVEEQNARLRSDNADLLANADACQHLLTRAVRAEAEVERLRVALEEASKERAEVARLVGYFEGDGSDEFEPTTAQGSAVLSLLATATETRVSPAEEGKLDGAARYAGMDWMDDVKVWRSALLRLVGGRTDHLAAMFGEEIARAAVAWGDGDSARWDNLSAPEQAHWVADHIERAAMLAADAATAPCAGPAPASTASPPTGT